MWQKRKRLLVVSSSESAFCCKAEPFGKHLAAAEMRFAVTGRIIIERGENAHEAENRQVITQDGVILPVAVKIKVCFVKQFCKALNVKALIRLVENDVFPLRKEVFPFGFNAFAFHCRHSFSLCCRYYSKTDGAFLSHPLVLRYAGVFFIRLFCCGAPPCAVSLFYSFRPHFRCAIFHTCRHQFQCSAKG